MSILTAHGGKSREMLAFVLALVISPPASYDLAQANLDESLALARDGTPEQVVATIPGAIAELEAFPAELGRDPEWLARRDLAMAALAFAYFSLEDEAAASRAVDDAIRTAREREAPVELFGSEFADFYSKRTQALASRGTARIEVVCSDCIVLIDEAPSAKTSEPLYLGEYRVTVIEGDELRIIQISLRKPDETLRVPPALVPPPPLVAPSSSEPLRAEELSSELPSKQGTHERKLPRWAEITGTAVGVAVLVAGAIILSYDGKCPDGLDPVTDRPACPKVYNAAPAGYSLIAGGAAVVSTFGALLIVDEVGSRRSQAQQVMVHYRLRF